MNPSVTGFNAHYIEEAPSLAEINALNGDIILEFGVPWCPHCQLAQPILQESMSKPRSSSLSHLKIYDGKGKRLGRTFNVKLWPTFIFLQNGKEVSRVVRPTKSNDMRKLLQQTPT